jgi:hypothetical protein
LAFIAEVETSGLLSIDSGAVNALPLEFQPPEFDEEGRI